MISNLDKTDFLQWIVGDINSNIKRAWLAEYLVDRALDVNTGQHMQWGDFDVKLGACCIEVKSSGFISPPMPARLFSKNPRFDIEPRKQGWCEVRGKRVNYAMPRRPADVYIFCLQTAENDREYQPFDVNQWQFACVLTQTLDRDLGSQKSISWSGATSLGCVSSFHTLKASLNGQLEGTTI